MSKEATARSAMKLALEGAANYIDALGGDSRKYRQALAEQPAPATELREQEPVAWVCYGSNNKHDIDFFEDEIADLAVGTMLYTPAQRTWVGLTDEEVEQACVPLGAAMLSFTEVARAIEAKLKEKNNV